MNAKRWILAALLVLVAFPAEAGRRARAHNRTHSSHHTSSLHVYVGPWTASYAPAARAGWVWVGGHYSASRWLPGYWRPSVARAGWLWVAGYWAGSVYVDGYWREEARSQQVWVDGYYDDDDSWVPGYWAPSNSADAQYDRTDAAPGGEGEQEVTVPDAPPPEPPSGTVYHDYD